MVKASEMEVSLISSRAVARRACMPEGGMKNGRKRRVFSGWHPQKKVATIMSGGNEQLCAEVA